MLYLRVTERGRALSWRLAQTTEWLLKSQSGELRHRVASVATKWLRRNTMWRSRSVNTKEFQYRTVREKSEKRLLLVQHVHALLNSNMHSQSTHHLHVHRIAAQKTNDQRLTVYPCTWPGDNNTQVCRGRELCAQTKSELKRAASHLPPRNCITVSTKVKVVLGAPSYEPAARRACLISRSRPLRSFGSLLRTVRASEHQPDNSSRGADRRAHT